MMSLPVKMHVCMNVCVASLIRLRENRNQPFMLCLDDAPLKFDPKPSETAFEVAGDVISGVAVD